MPDWFQELLLAAIGSTAITGGVGWWFKTRRDDRITRDLAHATEIKALQDEVKRHQKEIKDLLQDRIQYEMVRRESSDQTGKQLLEALGLLKDMTQKVGDITLALVAEGKRSPKS